VEPCPHCGGHAKTDGLLTVVQHASNCPRRLPFSGPARPFTRAWGPGSAGLSALVTLARTADQDRRQRQAQVTINCHEPDELEPADPQSFAAWMWDR
jgi:hypothetical protein